MNERLKLYWKQITLILVAVLLSIIVSLYIGYLKNKIGVLDEKVIKITADKELVIVKNNTIQSLLDNQNNAIIKIRKEVIANQLKHKAELETANKQSTLYKQKAIDLSKVQPKSSDLCKEANDLINGQLQ